MAFDEIVRDFVGEREEPSNKKALVSDHPSILTNEMKMDHDDIARREFPLLTSW